MEQERPNKESPTTYKSTVQEEVPDIFHRTNLPITLKVF